MRWESAYMGTQVAVVAASQDSYKVLDRHGLTSWQAGGCWILAEALSGLVAGKLHALVRDGLVDHVLLKVGDAYIDADGAYSGTGIVAKHLELEGFSARLISFSNLSATAVEVMQWLIPRPPSAVRQMKRLLQRQGIGERKRR